jgi:hypothetical protein
MLQLSDGNKQVQRKHRTLEFLTEHTYCYCSNDVFNFSSPAASTISCSRRLTRLVSSPGMHAKFSQKTGRSCMHAAARRDETHVCTYSGDKELRALRALVSSLCRGI